MKSGAAIIMLGVTAACVVGLLVITGFGSPSSEEVVLAFEEKGLEVGKSYPVRREPGWEESPVSDSFKEGTRFEIPSLGRDSGGRVFTFESREDLEAMSDYYWSIEAFFGPALHSHLYQDGLVLLQINGELPKTQADRYGEVLREEV